MNSPLLSLLSLAQRAGKLVVGYDEAVKALQTRNIGTLFLAKDLSARTRRNIQEICKNNHAESIGFSYSMDEIDFVLGKRTGIIGITENALEQKAKAAARLLAENNREDKEECSI